VRSAPHITASSNPRRMQQLSLDRCAAPLDRSIAAQAEDPQRTLHPASSPPPHRTPKRNRSCFLRLPAATRACLLETLTANLVALASSAESLLDEWATATPDAIAANKAALKMHVFLLHCVAMQAQEEAERRVGQPTAAAAPKRAAGESLAWRVAGKGDYGAEWRRTGGSVIMDSAYR